MNLDALFVGRRLIGAMEMNKERELVPEEVAWEIRLNPYKDDIKITEEDNHD